MDDSIINKKFGNWLVVKFTSSDTKGHQFFECVCLCGKIKQVRKDQLKLNKTSKCSSCANSLTSKTHGLSSSRTYRIWVAMRRRCYNKKNENYSRYGGRGISICEEWRHSFNNFFKDMGLAPEKLQIDRINVDGNYEPSNCRWVTAKQNALNRRNTINKENN